MDLASITPADFKALFGRDFPFLPTYSATKLYNTGALVYYPVTELFYTCKVDGTQGITPTDVTKWDKTADDVDNYVADEDISRAFIEAKILFNAGLFSTDETIKLGFLYLTAHYLVNDIRAAQGGASGKVTFSVKSRSVGNVSESYDIPEMYSKNPVFAFYAGSPYGIKYLSLVMPGLAGGGIMAVAGATTP